jgi:hypothetical protein
MLGNFRKMVDRKLGVMHRKSLLRLHLPHHPVADTTHALVVAMIAEGNRGVLG